MTDIMPPGYVKPLQRTRSKIAKRATDKMNSRGYDPIDGQLDLYDRLIDEDRVMCAIRDGSLVKITPSGPTQRYSSMAHAAILAQINKLHGDLLRFGYARVSETVIEQKAVRSPLVIELEGDDVRIINDEQD